MDTVMMKLLVPLCIFSAFAFVTPAFAEKVLMYDEEKGIVFVDKDDAKAKPGSHQPEGVKADDKPVVKKRVSLALQSQAGGVDNGLIYGKKKDPSHVYLESGLQFFKAGNYDDALQMFIHADSIDPQPLYSLWIGKTYRQLGKGDQELFIMKRILATYPDSSVAADALFEIGFYYQTSDDYEKAAATYTQLTEQYPFGKSYSNGEEFRDVAKRLKQMMRSDMLSTLRVLGYKGSELEDLYQNFQKDHGLQVTGLGSKETVSAIKQQYREFQNKEANTSAKLSRNEKYINISIVMSSLCMIVCVIMVFARISARGKKRHCLALAQALADLDTRKL